MLRRLRIAVSVFFAVVCVALFVLWARSHWRVDSLINHRIGGRSFGAMSASGRIGVGGIKPSKPGKGGLEFVTLPNDFLHWRVIHKEISGSLFGTLGFAWFKDDPANGVNGLVMPFGPAMPHWFLFLFSVTLAAAPWLPFSSRFSLRTMLIATTLVAVVLGLVCYTVW